MSNIHWMLIPNFVQFVYFLPILSPLEKIIWILIYYLSVPQKKLWMPTYYLSSPRRNFPNNISAALSFAETTSLLYHRTAAAASLRKYKPKKASLNTFNKSLNVHLATFYSLDGNMMILWNDMKYPVSGSQSSQSHRDAHLPDTEVTPCFNCLA